MSNNTHPKTSSPTFGGCKLVPWLNWKEWEAVRDSLFSNSQDMIAFALKRISTWRSRGCLPVLIDVTASIIEIQQKDPFYRIDVSHGVIESEQIMAMLYCMTILRFVNCVVEKTRKKNEVSIAEAASAIGIPRTLIDVRHDGSHRDLPALPLVRDSANKALHWLKDHYWEPQTKKIPFHRDSSSNLEKEINEKLLELSSIAKLQQIGSQRIKKNCGKHRKQLCGSNTFFLLYSGLLHSSKFGSFKKRKSEILNTLAHLYSSFSSQVVSALMKLLLSSLGASQDPSPSSSSSSSLLDDWKLVVVQFSEKEPELIPTLLKEILHMMEQPLELEASQAEQFCSLFAWLAGRLKEASKGKNASSPLLIEILRSCLLVSSFKKKTMLVDSALQLLSQISDLPLMEKITKLRSLMVEEEEEDEEAKEKEKCAFSASFSIIEQEESFCQATKKFELLKSCRTKRKGLAPVEDDDGGRRSGPRWRRATEFWRPCPIGMLPSNLGSSGRLPLLDLPDGPLLLPAGNDDTREKNKRLGNCDIYSLNNSGAKKPRGTEESFEFDFKAISAPRCIDGCLLVNGVWKSTRQEELHDILSHVKILV